MKLISFVTVWYIDMFTDSICVFLFFFCRDARLDYLRGQTSLDFSSQGHNLYQEPLKVTLLNSKSFSTVFEFDTLLTGRKSCRCVNMCEILLYNAINLL